MNNEKKMILKRVDIEGFKSFAKQTHIEFADKISAILGPNNVGKTNILDSIQWTLSDENADVSVIFSALSTRNIEKQFKKGLSIFYCKNKKRSIIWEHKLPLLKSEKLEEDLINLVVEMYKLRLGVLKVFV